MTEITIPPTEGTYDEHFVVFVDLLGFSEVSKQADDAERLKVLALLRDIAAMRREFHFESIPNAGAKTFRIHPAITTFSDHIVLSFPLASVEADIGDGAMFFILNLFSRFLASLAADALRIGFLIRGGATIGKLYHCGGVVFGKGLIDAYELESKVANYPRVVVSSEVLKHSQVYHHAIRMGFDGLYEFDYFKEIVFRSATPGDTYTAGIQSWLKDVVPVVSEKLAQLKTEDKLRELAKWTWFAREFRSGLDRNPPEMLSAFGIALDMVPWGHIPKGSRPTEGRTPPVEPAKPSQPSTEK